MAALLTRLNLLLTYRLFRSSVSTMIGLAVVLLYGVAFLAAAVFGAFFLKEADPHHIGWVTIWVFALVTASWPLLQSFSGGLDPLNPQRFALLPLRARDLQPGLMVATILSLEGIGVIVLWAAYLLAWAKHPVGIAIAVLAGAIGIPLTAASCRLGMTFMSARMASRRSQDRLMIGVTVVLLVVMGAFMMVDRAFTEDGEITFSLAGIEGLAPVVGWTPFGWLWSMPADAVAGVWWAVAVKLVLSVAVFAGVWLLWARLLDRALTTPFETGGVASHVNATERGISGILPKGPIGAIARRTLQYWRRDPRRKMTGIMSAVVPLILSVAVSSGAQESNSAYQLLVPLFVISLLGTSLVSAELTYDGGAVWHQIAAGTTGREDRWGRIIGLSVFVVPYVLVLVIGYLAWTGQLRHGVLFVGAAIGLLGIVGGVGSWVGTIWSYAVPPQGLSFNTSSSQMAGFVGLLVASIVQMILLAPVLVAGFAAYLDPQWTWLSVLVSVGVGAGALWGGVTAGASYLDDRWPEVLAQITWAKR